MKNEAIFSYQLNRFIFLSTETINYCEVIVTSTIVSPTFSPVSLL